MSRNCLLVHTSSRDLIGVKMWNESDTGVERQITESVCKSRTDFYLQKRRTHFCEQLVAIISDGTFAPLRAQWPFAESLVTVSDIRDSSRVQIQLDRSHVSCVATSRISVHFKRYCQSTDLRLASWHGRSDADESIRAKAE